MPYINYDVTFTPEVPEVTVALSIKENMLHISEEEYSAKVVLQPANDAILCGLMDRSLWAALVTTGVTLCDQLSGGKLLDSIGKLAADFANNYLEEKISEVDYALSLEGVLGHTLTIGGVPVDLKTDKLSLEAFQNTHLLLSGELEIQ